jgi:DNA-binding transcriptional ArsR family regulator
VDDRGQGSWPKGRPLRWPPSAGWRAPGTPKRSDDVPAGAARASWNPDRLDQAVETLAAALRAAGSPLRVRILDRLSAGATRVNDLAEDLAISQPLASQHLRILRSAGLVVSERVGTAVFYAIADAPLAAGVVGVIRANLGRETSVIYAARPA